MFFLFILFLIAVRLIELLVSNRNEKWLRANGAIEFGKKHYPIMVMLHSSFILSLIFEYLLRGGTLNYFFLFFFLLLIASKVYIVSSLGKYWNTKIFRIPNSATIKSGMYKYIKHPNYVIVIAEIAVIPLIFNLYYTALIFSILNAMMLTVRIREENKVWNDDGD